MQHSWNSQLAALSLKAAEKFAWMVTITWPCVHVAACHSKYCTSPLLTSDYTGASVDYLHPAGSGDSYAMPSDEFDASGAPRLQPSTVARTETPSNLSRVSMSIMKELSNAEWKIDPSSLILGKMIGKGGFGKASSDMAT